MKEKKQSGIGYVLSLTGRNRGLLLLSGIFSILSGICAVVPFAMVYYVLITLLSPDKTSESALTYALIAAVAIVLKFLFLIVALSFSHIAAFGTLYEARAQLSRHIGRINLGFFNDNTTGSVKKVIIEDTERVEQFLAHQVPDLVAATVVPITVFVYLTTVNIPMALCLLVPVIIGVLIQGIAMSITGRQMKEYHRLQAKLNASIMQFINGMPVMKIFNMTARGYREYSDTIKEYNAFWKRSTREQGYTYGIFIALVESGILFSLPLGGYLYLSGSLSLEAYLFFMIMSMVFLSSLLNLINFAQIFNQINTGARRIKDIMDIPLLSTRNQYLQKSSQRSLSFEDVTFSYNEVEVLKNVTISLPPGSLTAFVGASGAGKTTAAQLVPKFWEVTGGRICIDNSNINDLESDNLMENISFVFQDTFMLNDTVYNNIAIGKKSATAEEVRRAAEAAQIHDFIISLPLGYETVLGDSGVKMSGGEKQRICIARAVLKDAPLIIFDEATSYTDLENEYRIQLALSHLLKGKTTIMIAHRLHTIVNADQICVFEKGEVVQKGTHRQLAAERGPYQHMWKSYIGQEQEVVQ